MKKVLFLILSVFCSFLFVGQTEAKVTYGYCIYNKSDDAIIQKIELQFPFPSGNAIFMGYMSPSWQLDGPVSENVLELENRAKVQFKFRNENHACPAYIITAVGNWTHKGARKYYAAFTNEEVEEILKDNKNWANEFYTTYFSTYEEIDDGSNPDGNTNREYEKTYYSSTSSELGDLTFTLVYDEVNASIKQQKLSLSSYIGSVKWVSSYDVAGFKKNVLDPVSKNNSFPNEFWCGTIRSYFRVDSSANFILGGSASDGDVVCSLEKKLFLDNNGTIIHYKTTRENSNANSSSNNSSTSDLDSSSFSVNNIMMGKVCENPNLKVILKYIGWVISAFRLIIPIALIVLGVLDFMKAVTSQKPEELSKAIKTLLFRGIAAVVIFFVPIIVNFIFTLVDDWSQYKSSYSQCTVCLTNPKKC